MGRLRVRIDRCRGRRKRRWLLHRLVRGGGRDGDSGATGAHAHAGGGTVPTAPANTALFASVGSTSQVGLEARGRVKFPNRSGRAPIGTGKSSIAISVSGVTSSNFAIATVGSNRSGRYVRAVVCSTGKVTIYLNTTVTSATYVSWLVLG